MNAVRSKQSHRPTSRTPLNMKLMNLGTIMSPTPSPVLTLRGPSQVSSQGPSQFPTFPLPASTTAIPNPTHPHKEASRVLYGGVANGASLRVWGQPQRKGNGRYGHGRGAPPIGSDWTLDPASGLGPGPGPGPGSRPVGSVLHGDPGGVSLSLQKSLTGVGVVLPAASRPFFS